MRLGREPVALARLILRNLGLGGPSAEAPAS